MNEFSHISGLARFHGDPLSTAILKSSPEDFIVEEELSFEPLGEGEHVFLFIEKRGENTDYVAKQLARFAGVNKRAVSYAGLKDRNATTRQWFSVQMPGMLMPDWSAFNSDTMTIIDATAHRKKLKRGAIKSNRFTIRLLQYNADRDETERRINTLVSEGVPNYFGPQRFGRNENNLHDAELLFAGRKTIKERHIRGLVLSAARSFLFNRVLSERIKQGQWNQIIPGDVCNLDGSGSLFLAHAYSEELEHRYVSGDIHTTGPMWGKGEYLPVDQAAAFEKGILENNSAWLDGLERMGLDMARRPLRVIPKNVDWKLQQGNLTLSFSLDSGAYATMVLREIAELV